MAYRQKVLNVILAQLLQERGAIAAPENILKYGEGRGRYMPDVLVTYQGLRTAIEGEVGDRPQAQEAALRSALNRVEAGIAHIGVGVVYPQELRRVDFRNLKASLAGSQFSFAIVTESGTTGVAHGTADQLESALRCAFDQLIQEDVVARAVALLDAAIERFARAIVSKAGVADRLAQTLGSTDVPADD